MLWATPSTKYILNKYILDILLIKLKDFIAYNFEFYKIKFKLKFKDSQES